MGREVMKLKKNPATLIVMLTLLLGMGACTYHVNEFEKVEVPDVVSFELDVIPIFEAKCNGSGCHQGTIPPNLTRDRAYNSLMNGTYITDLTTAENNSFYQKISGGSMSTYASDQDRALIKAWIEDGAQNN